MLTGPLALGSAPFSKSFSSNRSNPPAHTAHRMGRPEASWEEEEGGSHEGGVRQRERRKPLQRGTTSKMGPLRKWRRRGEHGGGGGEGARGGVRGEGLRRRRWRKGVRKGRGEEVQKRGNEEGK